MQAVLFDFNGTLFDDTRFHLRAWRSFMATHFGIEMTDEEVRERFIGPDNHTIFRSYFGERYSGREVDAFCLGKEEVYRRVVRENPDNMRLIEGVPEMFDLLTERGVPFALATASQRENVDFYLNDLGLGKWFTLDRVVYDEGKLASKPDPAFYVEAARRLGAEPANCIVCEDSPAGVEAAKRFGAGRIVAIDRTAPREALEADPHLYAVIHDFRGFERLLFEN